MNKLLHSLLSGLIVIPSLFCVTSSPAQAEFELYQEIGGRDNVRPLEESVDLLSGLGLTLEFGESETSPRPDYPFAWGLLPPPESPSQRGTTAQFLYDPDIDVHMPLSGLEAFEGRLNFSVDTDVLDLPSPFVVGNFSVGFDEQFNFSAVDTFNTGLTLFEISSPNTPVVDLDQEIWTLDPINVVISQEFSDFLMAAGASESTAGLQFAEILAERYFTQLSTTKTPEPSSRTLIIGGLFVWCIQRGFGLLNNRFIRRRNCQV